MSVSLSLSGSSSLIFKLNQLPQNGMCYSDKYNGTEMLTNVLITCTNWTDTDGTIQNYEFYGEF